MVVCNLPIFRSQIKTTPDPFTPTPFMIPRTQSPSLMCEVMEAFFFSCGTPGTLSLGIIKGVGVKGYGVILIWDLNMAKFQTAITRHHWPSKTHCFCLALMGTSSGRQKFAHIYVPNENHIVPLYTDPLYDSQTTACPAYGPFSALRALVVPYGLS